MVAGAVGLTARESDSPDLPGTDEAGILNYGIDMTLDTNPYEVGLGWQVDHDQKGDFIGREALARIAATSSR